MGLWKTQLDELPPAVPIGGSVVVGHNFDSEAGFQRSFHHAGENLKSATWRNLLAFLKQVGISPEQCFFTNAYVGLRAGDRAMGSFPGARDHDFVCWCRNFLLEQFRLIQPRLILTLGVHVPGFLAPLSPELKIAWLGVTGLRMLDERGVALVYPSTFSGVLRPAVVVALTHPAYRKLNVKSRRYGNLQGDAAEQALVRDALTRVGMGKPKKDRAVSVYHAVSSTLINLFRGKQAYFFRGWTVLLVYQPRKWMRESIRLSVLYFSFSSDPATRSPRYGFSAASLTPNMVQLRRVWEK